LPARDSRGRWVRRTVPVEETPAQDFVFSDRVFEDAPAAAIEVRPADGIEPSPPRPAPDSAWRIFSRPQRLLGGALLLGVALFVVQRGFFKTERNHAAAPTSPPANVAPAAPPPDPKLTVRRPATQAVAAPRINRERETAAVSAPAAVHPDPNPSAAAPDAPDESAPPAPPERPGPPSVVESASLPAIDGPPPATSEEEGWFNTAEEYLQMGDDKGAETIYRRILDEGTQRGRAALALGDIFARRNDFSRAQEFYRASRRLFMD
jgi:hypothetical protein